MLRMLLLVWVCLIFSMQVWATPVAEQWHEHIRSHTSGNIAKNDSIRIRFMHDVISEEELSQDASALLAFSPPIEGTAAFINRRELRFQPQQALRSGQTYQVKLQTEALLGLPKGFKHYAFNLQVIQQALSIKLDNFQLQDSKTYQLRGHIETADRAKAEQVEKILQARLAAKHLKITWQHGDKQRIHRFVIQNIRRSFQLQSLKLQWSGQSIGVKRQGNHAIAVPSLAMFGVVKMQAVQDKQRYLQLFFSDDLDDSQDLQGLIQLNGHDYKMRRQGNQIKVYHALKGKVTVTVSASLKNIHGFPLGKDKKQVMLFAAAKPQVRFVGQGVILPNNRLLSIPFEAINAHAVQVTAFRVYQDNIGQFLQDNQLSGQENMQRLGRFLWRKTIDLGDDVKEETWQRFALDASELLKKYPNDMFRLTLSIHRGNVNYPCSVAQQQKPVVKEAAFKNQVDLEHAERPSWHISEADESLQDSQAWAHRHDPCQDAYYVYSDHVTSERNFLASNIGLIAKSADDHHLHIVSTNLATGQALPDVTISVYNFQNQRLAQFKTDKQGFANYLLTQTPFYLVAEKDQQKGYLKLAEASALPSSHFDVGGEHVQQGVKGHIYAERGVWRPGDAMFLTFVLLDKEERIPELHPVRMRLYNPRGQLVQSLSNHQPVGRFYHFQFKTDAQAMTGVWRVEAELGGMTFSKALRVETVRPNRLKMALTFASPVLRHVQGDVYAELSAQWLHGASAAALKTDVNVSLSAVPTRFENFPLYAFDDPVRRYQGKSQVWFQGQLDEHGKVIIHKALPEVKAAAGMLMATFRSRVFEKGGGFSVDAYSMPYHPYAHYVGLKLPKGDALRGMLLTDQKHRIQLATVDSEGEAVDLDQLQVRLYKINWKWWWDQSGDDLAQYASSSYHQAVLQEDMKTKDGVATLDFVIKKADWGRYLLRVCDVQGGHCTGKVLYVDWPGWASRAQKDTGGAATRLALSSDRTAYHVGDVAKIRLPAASQGRALLSIETSQHVLQQKWIRLDGKRQSVNINITKEMAPNAYVHISLIQPHQYKKNDLPIRLYGIVPLHVLNPATLLKPVLDVADEVRPERRMRVGVQEQQGKSMTYTLAIVDEGLLSLTRFKTPDLHHAFYQKEALGVLTWDVFDDVVGAYGGQLERLLALGGGAAATQNMAMNPKKKRFPPVVQFLGPFTLQAGEKAWHEVMLPQYLGAVRVMLVAGSGQAFGQAEKTVMVRDPLSLLVSMPRVLGIGETLHVPVSLFAMQAGIEDVQLELEVDDHLEVIGDALKSIHFSKQGEKMAVFHVRVKDSVGQTTLRFMANSGMYQASTQVHLDVRLPNVSTQRRYQQKIDVGKLWSENIVPHGIAGTQRVSLEVSMLPPMNIRARLQQLITYPHGCVEQTVSSVFPQIFLADMMQIAEHNEAAMTKHIQAAITRLQQFQLADGSFAYWPGSRTRHDWSSSYVGHFLLYAKKHAYVVPETMLQAWLSAQKQAANAWVVNSQTALNQSYRLYTLALAGQAELGAMNRLRELEKMSSVARWQLSSAYRVAGLADVADALVQGDTLQIKAINIGKDVAQNFSSHLRDQAMLLHALALKGDARAESYAQEVAQVLSSERVLNTQEIAFSLLALTHYATEQEDQAALRFEQIVGVESSLMQSAKPVYHMALSDFPSAGDNLGVVNHSNQPVYATIVLDGVPEAGKEKASAQGLSLQLSYHDAAQQPLHIERLTQGQDVRMTVTVRNRSHHDLFNLALTQLWPSGWELASQSPTPVALDAQDVRDDRVYRYFSLARGKEKSFELFLNAAYRGKYFLPAVKVEAMYDASVQAQTVGQWVEVVQ